MPDETVAPVQTRAGRILMSTFIRNSVRVRVPATSANVGPGFDTLGLALGLYDHVEMRIAADGLRIDVRGQGADTVSEDEDNLLVRAARATFEHLGVAQPGLSLTCTNQIPHGAGLGSSAAAIIAGVSAARALVSGAVMTDAEMFGLAAGMEGHPDNVAACIGGGLTVAWGDGASSRWVRLEPAASLAPVAIVADETMSTTQARGLLPGSVSHRDAAVNAGRAALLVAAITGRPELLFDATEDRLHQEYRAAAMPRTADLLAKLRASGLAAVVSGAGPTVLVLAQQETAGSIGRDVGEGWTVHRLSVDRQGAQIHAIAR